MKTVTINLYSFDELSEEAKTKAILEHYDFLCSIGEWDVANDEIATEFISENIRANDYIFLFDGTFVKNCEMPDETTEITIGGEIYKM